MVDVLTSPILSFILLNRLDIIPGLETSILQYEEDLLLEIDVAHKILRSECVLDVLYSLYSKDRANFQRMAAKQIIGSIVMTR